MNRLILLLVLSALSYSISAQNNYDELIHASYDYLSPSRINSTQSELSRQQINFAGGYGFQLNEKQDLLNIGLNYQWVDLKTDLAGQPDLSIHNIGLGLEWLKHWKNPRWASHIAGGMSAISDFNSSPNSIYQTSLSASLLYGKSNDLIWSFGILYSDQPFGPWIFPILGVDWNLSDRLYFSTILFSHTYLEYTVKRGRWYAGVDFRDMGLSFVVADYQGEKDSYITSFSDAFPYYPYTLTIFNDVYFKHGITLFAKTGLLFSRENRHYSRDHQEIEGSVFNNSVVPSFYLNAGVAWRYRRF